MFRTFYLMDGKSASKVNKKLAENHVYFIDDVTVGELGFVFSEATRKHKIIQFHI